MFDFTTVSIAFPTRSHRARLLVAAMLAFAALVLVAVPAAFAASPLSGITDQLTSDDADEESTDEGGLLGVVDDVLDEPRKTRPSWARSSRRSSRRSSSLS